MFYITSLNSDDKISAYGTCGQYVMSPIPWTI